MSQITVNPFIFFKLKEIKLALSREIDDYKNMEPGEKGSEISWNAVFTTLIKGYNKNIELQSKIVSQDLEILKLKEGRGDEMKDLLEKTITNKAPIYVQVGAMAQSSNFSGLVPPKPPKLYIPKKVSGEDSKGLFKNEINELLGKGGVKMPSEIMNLSEPDHINNELEFIDYEVEQLPLSEKEIKFAKTGKVRRDSE